MSQTYSPSTPPTSRLSRLPVIGWILMTLLAGSFILMFGFNLPYADEWEFVPALVGREPVAKWLWAQHNEHRLPLSRAVYYSFFQLTHDFRAGMYVQIALLSGLALALMAFAARLRGRPDWPDLFFPMSLLHIGHWENFLMGYQICFVFFCVLATALGIVAFRTRRNGVFRSGLAGGILLLLLALTGGVGLVMVPAVVPWLLYLAIVVWRSGSPSRATLLVVLALLPVAYVILYFDGYQRPAHHPKPSHDPLAVGMVTGEVLAMAFGEGVAPAWALVVAVESIVGLLTLGLLLRQVRDPDRRPAAAGLIGVMAGMCGLALAIGVGRGAFGTNMGLWSRYALLTWPLIGITYLIWLRTGRRLVPILFCTIAALAFIPNLVTGMCIAEGIFQLDSRIEADARQGRSAREIVDRDFPNSANAGQIDRGVQNIPLLRAAGIGAFGEVR